MLKQYFIDPQGGINYGPLTIASKGWNLILGDTTDRTVSRTIAHGFKDAFNLHKMSDDNAEHIVHAIMLATLVCSASRNQNLQLVSGVLGTALLVLYLNGR